ncbi:MAG: hypothetical protein WC878_07705 [Candidatus Paceibacterota bacterium]|jgi:hypothetical protein
MKQHFEETLRVFSDVAKEKTNEPLKEIRGQLEKKELEEMVPDTARVQVLELQEEKQRIIKWLHEQIQAIDRKEEVRSIREEREDSKDYYVDENMNVKWKNEMVPITKGDLATDGEWGLLYNLDKSLPRDVKKEFVVAEAKRAIRDLLDKQIATTETSRRIPKWADEGMKQHMEALKIFYGGILGTNIHNKPWESLEGMIAEKMITTTMEKFKIDNDVSYEFFHGDASDDAERKLDCYLVIPEHTRGVKTRTEDREDIGIQLLVGPKTPTEHQIQKKERAIAKSKRDFGLEDIDDLVLISLSYIHSRDKYDEWIQKGRKPGGPEKLWDEETQIRVFYGILKGFFEDDTIEEMWNNRMGRTGEERIKMIERKIQKEMENPRENLNNEAKKTKKQKISRLKQGIDALSKNPNPNEKTKKKIDKKRRELELLQREFPSKSTENKMENDAQLDKKRINALHAFKQEIKEEMEQAQKNGAVKIYTPEEVAEYQQGLVKKSEESKIADENRSEEYFRKLFHTETKSGDVSRKQTEPERRDKNGLKIIDDFNKKYGGTWFGKKK